MKKKSEEGLWGPIDLEHWKDTPCIKGRCATEEDVQKGLAVFSIKEAKKIGVEPADLDLPLRGIEYQEDEIIPVIVIQVEIVPEEDEEKVLCGVRYLEGGNNVCTGDDIELIDTDDDP